MPVPGSAVAARLQDLVRSGGGLIVAIGDRAAGAAATAASRALLPAQPNGIADVSREGGVSLGTVERSHPVFDAFRASRSGDLMTARFLRHARLAVSDRDSAAVAESDVLARFADGAPALMERRIAAGRVLLLAAPLDTDWSDLPLQPFYLPLLHRMVLYAANWKATPPMRTVGDMMAFEPGDYVAVAPGGERMSLDADRPVLPLMAQGFHEVRDGRRTSTVLQTIAVNTDVAESDLSTLPAAELQAAVQAPAGTEPAANSAGAAAAAAAATPADVEHRQSLWWYLMVVGFALLAIETVVSNRLSRRTLRTEASA
jgi:hypothetical protein